MHTFIAAVMTVLGTALVLAGVAVIIARASAPTGDAPVAALPPSVEVGAHPASTRQAARLLRLARRVYPSDRLIGWGIVLLLMAAAVAGMIGVDLRVSTTGH
jgi:hypothetical protein